MKRSYSSIKTLVSMALLTGAVALAQSSSQPWQSPYSGAEAYGPDILALWQFPEGDSGREATGKPFPLKPRGASVFARDERGGGCLESFFDVAKPNGAVAEKSEGLTPASAFTLELWAKAKSELAGKKSVFLLDKMYVDYAHPKPGTEQMRDYVVKLLDAGKGLFRIEVGLGFGDAVVRFASAPVSFEAGVWHHVAFTYDGAGEGSLFLDGEECGRMKDAARKAILGGSRPLVLGDRIGSGYGGFPGFLRQVRLVGGPRIFAPADLLRHTAITAPARTSFLRMEKDNQVALAVANRVAIRRPNVSVRATLLDGKGARCASIALPVGDLEGSSVRMLDFPFDTTLKEGAYALHATLLAGDGSVIGREVSIPLFLAPRPPVSMPVINWGTPTWNDEAEMKVFKDCFTHAMGYSPNLARVWNATKAVGDPAKAAADDQAVDRLNRALREGFRLYGTVSPARMTGIPAKSNFIRVDRDGKPYREDQVCCLFPEVQEYCGRTGAAVAQAYGRYPAFDLALIHSEVVDEAHPCFHDHDRKAFAAWSGGLSIPEGISASWGGDFRQRFDFPPGGVVPDAFPLLKYYQWYWKEGHGWNQAHTCVHQGLKSTGRDDLRTWFDPAVRAPALWGSGGGVDAILEWSYTHPDPLRVAAQVDELFAMADGAVVAGSKKKQQVFKMTQIIWYRSQSAPKPKAGAPGPSPRPSWEETEGNAEFITMAPDHLRESLWLMLARPVAGLGYHGWQSLVSVKDFKGSYRFTDARTAPELARLVKTVVRPLGPMLLEVPDRSSDVAYLESFASQVLAGKGSGWADKARYYVLQYAQVQPRVVYEETILRDGLDAFKVLVAHDCDVLPEAVVKKIKAFQDRGGLLVADASLCPALIPDLTQPAVARTKKAEIDRRALLNAAAVLREGLDPFYSRYVDSSNPDVLTRVRTAGSADYVFAINDLRKYGDYVGMYERVMEDGLPSKTTLTLARRGGFAYDLVGGREVKTRPHGKGLAIDVDLGPCEGAVFLVTERPIAQLSVQAAASARAGSAVPVTITVADATGKKVDAVVPVKLTVLDGEGREAERSGYHAAPGGILALLLDLAPNERAGTWKIQATELASGKKAEATLRVE